MTMNVDEFSDISFVPCILGKVKRFWAGRYLRMAVVGGVTCAAGNGAMVLFLSHVLVLGHCFLVVRVVNKIV